uniref:Uncharacterized protein n=1 Tax=Setaria italica TaxID=4555 RepID=K3ZE43_SETIT
ASTSNTSLVVSMLWYLVPSEATGLDGFVLVTNCIWSLLSISRRSATSFIVGLSSPLGLRQCMTSSASFSSTTITSSSIISQSTKSQSLFWLTSV